MTDPKARSHPSPPPPVQQPGLRASTELLVWGHRPLALLPEALRTIWANEQLPPWVVSELHLPGDATFAALGAGVWAATGTNQISTRLRGFLTGRLAARAAELKNVRLVQPMWPRELDPRGFPWSHRLRSALSQGQWLTLPGRLSRATVSEVMGIRSLGEVSVLELATVAELVLERARLGPAATPDAPRTSGHPDESWTRAIHGRDPRFRQFIPIRTGTLADHLGRLRVARSQLHDEVREFRAVRRFLRSRLEEIRNMSLEAALLDFVQSASGLDRVLAGAVVRRLGLHGEVSPVTRSRGDNERLRRLEQQFLRNLPGVPVFLPQLDEALAILERLAPCHVTDASEILRARELGRGTRNVEMVLTAGELLARHPSVTIDATGQLLIKREFVNSD